jgi:hypothetical protein
LASSEGDSGELNIHVRYPHPRYPKFTLYNTHSLPENKLVPFIPPTLSRDFGASPLRITYTEVSSSFSRQVLGGSTATTSHPVIEPHHPVGDVFTAPFFLQDRRHVFFVRSVGSRVPVGGYADFGLFISPQASISGPSVLIKPDIPWPPEEVFFRPDLIKPGFIDPMPMENFLREKPLIHQALGMTGTIQFGARMIGPSGSIIDENTKP